ncbi:conserved hypothetical protein [Sporisorium reilianum SRZ2]|uniref:Uncharacterized protein n=1 Tax=Sporisorium reilianum (strain SRZ2) TaxID=999809 RepID=E7A3H4_SPORE|nr:conserved hypothetical protein [Sporisorium reilianum SRZ2]
MEALVKAAVQTVLYDAQGPPNDPSIDPRDALQRDVSLFLRSMQQFPQQPLPFPVAAYRDFFVLVARWRHEFAIDARHTIDSTRRWIELSSASERTALDQDLVDHPDASSGPVELTSRLLVLLMVLHTDNETCVEEVDSVAHLLVESLERAAESAADGSMQLLGILALLGILLDAFAELNWLDATCEDGSDLFTRAARLLVNLVWRDHELVKMAVGILNRIVARDAAFTVSFAAETASAILTGLLREANNPFAAVHVEDAGPLVSVAAIFRDCLGTMLETRYEDAIVFIEHALLEPLSCLLRRLIECAFEAPGDEHVAELDRVATMLFDVCDKALQGQPI